MTLQEHLTSLGACELAKEWALTLTATEAWETCERSDWLLWWAAKTNSTKVDIVRVAIAIAKDVLYLAKNTGAATKAIEASENWCDTPTEANRRIARKAADAAYADAAAAAYAAAAADAAAYADAYADAAADAAAAAAGSKKQEYCRLIRQMLKQPWIE